MPKIREVRKYLNRHGWELYRNTDHEYYRLKLSDGSYRYTRLSHGDGEIPVIVWKRQLKQIGITQEEFNRG
ncbi:MAG: type II toxin-antitoxin system HicA family toxin [Synergistaceae bacterium]|nr:type II toxin-antitoxin system HicA family toxin [Synergistaceae bacterium]MBQ3450472.1 type II toxin-antitoxin system HicA family toxin [Synergistaceae bacterium]MBQ9628368.1 type II toxin-antitoxin system HicA family toxin [Synergistaceae bacterium]MBR0069856.1 type II toxin-antitoxin system HicA family toxin [Synergistaceae bacterium]MBR0251688.1 type II toxin-antitoxin system HicA family toxin [Synergistaceae bacterium]